MYDKMYGYQIELNKIAGLDVSQENLSNTFDRVSMALSAELGEAISATKPAWVWWKRFDQQEQEFDPAAVLEEIIDCHFFLLTMLQVLVHSNAKTDNEAELQEKHRSMEDLLIDIQGVTADSIQQVQDKWDNPSQSELYMYAAQSLRMATGHNGNVEFNVHDNAVSMLVYLAVAAMALGYDWRDILVYYQRKALENLDRWTVGLDDDDPKRLAALYLMDTINFDIEAVNDLPEKELEPVT